MQMTSDPIILPETMKRVSDKKENLEKYILKVEVRVTICSYGDLYLLDA